MAPKIYEDYGGHLSVAIKAGLIEVGFINLDTIKEIKSTEMETVYKDVAKQIFMMSHDYNQENDVVEDCKRMVKESNLENFSLAVGQKSAIDKFFRAVQLGERRKRNKYLKRWINTVATGVDVKFGPKLRGNKTPLLSFDEECGNFVVTCFVDGCEEKLEVAKEDYRFNGKKFYTHLRNEHRTLVEESKEQTVMELPDHSDNDTEVTLSENGDENDFEEENSEEAGEAEEAEEAEEAGGEAMAEEN